MTRKMTRQEMIDMLDSHDCHLSPYDGCKCVELRTELARLNFKTDKIPYKYHSKLRTGSELLPITEKEKELELWNEVREDRV